jgi:glycosyltransferase involved in cell wall biosynthesis
MASIFFVCPDDNTPYGGIRVLYRCVDTLNAAGRSATIVHLKAGFRCTWFENRTKVIPASEVRFVTGDLIVLPEWYKEKIPFIAPGVPHLVFNQGPHVTFLGSGIDRESWKPVVSSDTVGIVANSPYTFEYLSYCFPEIPVHQITLGIDPDVFHPPQDGKEKQIAFMPRKRRGELVELLRILDLRRALDGWTLAPIDHMTEAETAAMLRKSAVFLSLNEREGFGLPSLEAMASGCVVVGFHGGCGRVYMRPDVAIPIDDGEVITFAQQAESVLHRFGDEDLERMREGAISLVRTQFTPAREAADVVAVFGRALDQVAAVSPVLTSLNVKLLASRRFPPLKDALAFARRTLTKT